MKIKPMVVSLFAVGISVGLAAGISLSAAPFISMAQAANPRASANAGSEPIASMALPNFSQLVEKDGPAVVNVTVTSNMKISDDQPQLPQFGSNDPFSQFFHGFQWPKVPSYAPVHGMGSGFIISPDGVILTNAHVVDGAKEVTVKLVDKREFKAKVIGKDDPSDVAVLKIDASNLPTVKIGDSSQVKVGQWVLAIGSPFGFENSVTAGIVSATSRSLPNGNYVPFLQTDVAVNPGNSGGPLINLNGEVVGINSQIYSRSGGYQGLSFAIPINVAENVENQLVHSGHVTRGRLGVTIQDVNQGLADSFGLKKPVGALVSSVDPSSPAAAAGLKVGDVILQMDGKDVVRSSDLPVRVAELNPGSKATLLISRKGETRDVTVIIGEAMEPTVATANEANGDHGRLGLAVRPLTPEERQQAGVKGGLLVYEATGPAAKAGIEPGDVIMALNGKPVTSVEQLRSLVEKAGKHFALLIQHEDATIFVPIDLG